MSPRTPAQNEAIRQARTQEILTVARQEFAKRGFHATRMSDIARSAGVSHGTLYHYFHSKDDLFTALLIAWAERLEETAGLLSDTPLGAVEKVRLVGQVGMDFMAEDRDLLPVMMEFWAYALRDPAAAASFRRLFEIMQQTFTSILQDGISSGEFKPVSIETHSVLPMVVLDGVIVLSLLVGQEFIDPDQVIRDTQELILEAIQMEPGGAAS